MKRTNTPPLGPRPRFVLEWERIDELKQAIHRYTEANWPLPPELVAEYNELTDRLELEVDASVLDMMKRLKDD